MNSALEKNSSSVRKRIENHVFEDEEGEEYEGSEFNGFGDYFRRKKIKLQNLDFEIRAASDKPPIFKGVVAHVNGYTQPPLQALHRDIVQHGGGFLQYLDSKTMATHIITATLPPKKAVEFSRYRIVKPAWVVDSVKAGKLLPWTDYRVLGESPSQKVLKFDGDGGLTQSSPAARRGYREQTENSFYTSQIMAEKQNHLTSQPMDKSPLSNRQQSRRSDDTLQSVAGTAASKATERHPISEAVDEEELGDEPADFEEQPASISADPTDPPIVPPKQMTSEEHNAWLLSDPKIRKSSTANPDFLKQFYSESRLHHLSTWKASLKSSMQRLAAEKGLSNRKTISRPGSRRYILHVDFDSFFCAVSLKRHPEYLDKPSAVAHSTGAGSEIASCNYVARGFGVKNGMWMKRALELCPDLKVLPYDFPAYEDVSRQFYEAIMGIGGIVQSVSVDEALVDATDVVLAAAESHGIGIEEGSIWREQQAVDEMALALRNKIKEKTDCAVSVGIGANILQARVALRKAKPAGQFQLKPEQVMEVIGDLNVEDLPGVAYSIGGKLEGLGVKLVKDIRDVPRDRLISMLGPKTSDRLHDYARGIDRTEVGEQPPRKSVSAEVSWGIRFISQAEAEEFVYNLCKELEKRLVNEQVKGKHLTMKIMRRALDAPLDPAKHLGHGKCDSFNKSAAFGVATHDYEIIGKEAVSILRSFRFSPGDLRGIGVQMTKLEPIRASPLAAEGSQTKIAFAPSVETSPLKKQPRVEVMDGVDRPESSRKRSIARLELDPQADDDLATSRKHRAHPARVGRDDIATAPLNVSNTQFVLPSSPDPAVLAELPCDIRTKLMAQRPKAAATGSNTKAPRSISQSPVAADLLSSQVDLEVFNALPDDMKAEVLALYGRRPKETLPPEHSPTKSEAAQPRRPTTPTRPSGARSGIFDKAQRQRDAQEGLIQTNFRAPGPMEEVEPEEIEELDPEFLAELPEDVRKEVIADHRRRQLALQSGLEIPFPKSHREAHMLPGGQTMIQFPVLPPVISFAGSISPSSEIKDMVDAWHSQTRMAGPHRRDVDVLESYLVKVIKEERDLNKAVVLIKWLGVLVDQDGVDSRGRRAWKLAVSSIKAAMQAAVEARGLAPLQI